MANKNVKKFNTCYVRKIMRKMLKHDLGFNKISKFWKDYKEK